MTVSPASIASDLWRARQTGVGIDPPAALDQAAADAILEALERTAPEPVGAWKVGATAPGAPEKLGLSGPFVGPVFAPYVQEIDSDDEAVTVATGHGLGVELELVFRFGETVPAGAAPEDAVGAIEALALGIELVAARWTSPTDPPGPGVVADHAGNSVLLVGPFEANWRALDLVALEGVLTIDGAVAGRARGANVMGDPLNAVHLFARTLAARGREIPAGTILTSGAIVGPLPIAPSAHIAGTIAGLSPVTIRVAVGES